MSKYGENVENLDNLITFDPIGCKYCNGTGFYDRIGVFEILNITDEIKEEIMNGKSSLEIRRKALEQNYKPLVILTNSKGLLNMRYAPKEIKNATIRSDALIEYIKKDIAKYDKNSYFSKKSMESWAQSILNRNVSNSNQDLEKYKNDDVNKDLLTERLKEYRRNKAKDKNIPAYYIFTDNEMEQIIKLHPKNYDELAKSNILNQTKLKFHGAEIIKVINNN